MSFAAVGTFFATYGTAIAAGTAAVSTAVSTYAAYSSSQNQKKVAEHNAKLGEIQAQDAQRRGDKAADDARHKGDALMGAQRAAFAARGLDLTDGTTAALLDQSSFFSLSDQNTARNNAAREAWARRAGADSSQMEADSINPLGNAASTFVSGASSVANKWMAYGGTGQKPTNDWQGFGGTAAEPWYG